MNFAGTVYRARLGQADCHAIVQGRLPSFSLERVFQRLMESPTAHVIADEKPLRTFLELLWDSTKKLFLAGTVTATAVA